MMELRTLDLKKHLEFNFKDVGYKEKREAVIDPITAMEIGNHENDYYENAGDWWGGDVNDDNYGNNEENYQHKVNYSGYGSKENGLKGKECNYLAKGKGKGHKGKGGQKGEFQGTCLWCGKWGHTASR